MRKAEANKSLRIFLFWHFEIRRADIPFSLSKKEAALLKILVSQRGRTFTRGRINEDSFGLDYVQFKSEKDLQRRISTLRKKLEPELGIGKGPDSQFISTHTGMESSSYSFKKDAPCWIDIEEFDSFKQVGDRSMDSDDFRKGCENHELALKLYRGEFLHDDPNESWIREDRKKWRGVFLDCSVKLAKCYTEIENYTPVIEVCERALNVNNLKGSLYRYLMWSYFKLGEVVSVRETFEWANDCFREEGFSLGKETIDCYRNILDETPKIIDSEKDQGKISIAVLPFRILAKDSPEELEIFRDGLHEDIISQLTKIHGLITINRESTSSYKDTGKPSDVIAKELNATFVLKGSLRYEDERTIATSQLVNSETLQVVWIERFDHWHKKISEIQLEITMEIIKALDLVD